jgi:hypothetical protein
LYPTGITIDVLNERLLLPPVCLRKKYYQDLHKYKVACATLKEETLPILTEKEIEYARRHKELETINEHILEKGGHIMLDTDILHNHYEQRIDLNQARALLQEANDTLLGGANSYLFI